MLNTNVFRQKLNVGALPNNYQAEFGRLEVGQEAQLLVRRKDF
jgi:hypothetical protein